MNKRPIHLPHLPGIPHLFTFLFSLFTALALCTSARGETVTIASAADWAAFASRVNAGETSLSATMTAHVRLPADAPLVGDSDAHLWSGTFDGGGHTLTVNWTFTGTLYAAPFAYTAGCTIRNLRIAGTITTDSPRAAGFIGWARPGNTTLERCQSSVTLTCTASGDACCAGFVAYTYWSSYYVNFRDCLFDGTLLGPAATHCGGFAVNAFSDPHIGLSNCFFAPADVTFSDEKSATFGHSYRSGNTEHSNCYYTRTFGTAQGTDASSMAPTTLAATLGANWKLSAEGVPVPASILPVPFSASFTYQGSLVNAASQPYTGHKTVEFRLYDTATGGTPLWGRAHDVLLSDTGLFNAPLADASGTPLPDAPTNAVLDAILAEKASVPLWLGLTVTGSSGEVAPRQRLIPVPVASFALDLANASGDLSVTNGTLSANRLSVPGRATAGTLNVTGDATVHGNLAVAGGLSGPGSFPVGTIILWSGSINKIPDGWALCDGKTANGRVTPDLRNRFVVGAGASYSVGDTGGTDTVTLAIDQLPAHRHHYAGDDQLRNIQNGEYNPGNSVVSTPGGYDAISRTKPNDSSDHWVNESKHYTTSSAGSGKEHENRPPYYALCYIMRVK